MTRTRADRLRQARSLRDVAAELAKLGFVNDERGSPFSASCLAAAHRYRENQLPKVVQGVKFQSGIKVIKMPANHAA